MHRPTFLPEFASDDPGGQPDYAQAVVIGDRLETSGQGGWDANGAIPVALADEIHQAFANLEVVLLGAGATWNDVVSVESWHAPLDEATYGLMVAEFRTRMKHHRPIWTALAVPHFGLTGMRVEIRVVAIMASRVPGGS